MIRFIGKRILQMIPVVLLVATLIFGILYLVPGDPAQIMLGSTASEYELAEMREQLGLNRPFIVQLGEFLSETSKNTDSGNCLNGISVWYRNPAWRNGSGSPEWLGRQNQHDHCASRRFDSDILACNAVCTLIFIKTWLVPGERNRRLGVLCASDSFTLFRWSCHSGTTGEIKYA